MPASGGAVTRLLSELHEGNLEAANRRVPLVYSELRRMPDAYMQRERLGHTLQATALVNEAYMRLVGGEPTQWQNRSYFFVIAAHTMRQLLNYARRRDAVKRGGPGARRVDIERRVAHRRRSARSERESMRPWNEALERLAQIDPRQSRLVELRFFAGLDVEEAAEVMGVSAATIKREWRSAKAWMHRELAAAKPG
jgi:RNA polymerase sigma factor (TIGR02999 family)